jgi:vacuolar-type H+-ATPase subunit H
MAQIFLDRNKHAVLVVKETETVVEFVQHVAKSVGLLPISKDRFHREYTQSDGKTSVVDFAKKLHALAKSGVSVTPAARFALEQVICLTPTNQEAPMAIPTTLKSDKKAAPAKKATPPAKKTIAQAAAEEAQPLQKLSEQTPHAETASILDKIAENNKKLGAFSKPTVTTKETPVKSNEVELTEAEAIVASARAEAEKLIQEATAMVEEAKKKFAEKKALDDAKAEAKKITDKAKAEVAKLKASIAKLGGRSSRKPKAEGEKAVRDTEDITGKKIKLLVQPTVREGSAAGLRTETICGCKTVNEALEYEGVTPFYIKKLVAKGYLELV